MASAEERVKEHWDIPKLVNDKKSYKGLTLSNDMKVLIISDPEAGDKCYFALDINIGYNCDPPESAGLAHLCEHVLLSRNNFYQYLLKNGGKCNASTYFDHTLYHFEINRSELDNALDRFTDLLLKTNFKKEYIKEQVRLINCEHSANMKDDSWRFAQVDKRLMKESHPLGRSSLNPKTLMKTAREKQRFKKDYKNIFVNFINKYYSANVMSLCILSKDTLHYLEGEVILYFSQISSPIVTPPTYDENPYDKCGIKVFIKPLTDTFAMMLRFPLSLQQPTHYYPELAHYFSYLLESQEEGTLLSHLKSKEWCNSLVSGKLTIAKNINFFNIAIDLTEDGLSHIDEIITLVFQYIADLKKEGPLKTVFDECQKIADMNSRYEESTSSLSYVISKVQEMQIRPLDQILQITRTELTFENWGKSMITEIMNCLSPQNVRVYIMTNLHEFTSQDKEFDIEYSVEKIPEEIINVWEKGFKDFRLPTLISQFMAKRFNIKRGSSEDSGNTKHPVVIKEEPLMRVWHKQDNEFLVPKTYTIIDFNCSHMNKINTHFAMLYIELFCDSFKSYPYANEVAGLKWELFKSNIGMTFAISGYDDKQALLIEHLMDHLVKFKPNLKRFDVVREEHKQVLDKIKTSHPYQYAMFALATLLTEENHLPTSFSGYDVNIHVTLTNMRRYMQEIFYGIHLECFIYGNTTKEEALKIADILHKKITEIKDVSPLSGGEMPLSREIKLENCDCIRYYAVTDQHNTSCTLVFYQDSMRWIKPNVILELLAQIISKPCQYILKTKKGLGHDVSCGVFNMSATQGLRFIVQSNKGTTQNIEKEIDTFVDSISTRISRMTPTEFNNHKEILIASRRNKATTFNAVATMLWDEILMQQYKFDRITEEAKVLEGLTKKDIQNYCKKFLHGNIRRKFAIYIIQQKEQDRLSKVASNLSNHFDLRRGHQLFPLLTTNNYSLRNTLLLNNFAKDSSTDSVDDETD